jgi:class III poly(R)-hydroxyalkanoic acid synthase PhaE subunit
MTWNEQADSMMKVWTEAQKTMMQSWYNAVQSASTPAFFNPGIVEEWRKFVMNGMEAWTGGTQPAFKGISSQFVSAQAAMMQALQFTTQAWQAMAPQLDAGGDWQTVLSKYVEQMRQQMMPDAEAMSQATQDTAQLWRMYMERITSMSQPWMGVAGQLPSVFGGAMSGEGSSQFMELTKMYWNAFDTTFGSLSQSPGFGLTREHEERLAKGFEAWQKVQRSYNDYQVLMADAWSGVFEQVLNELKDRSENDKPVQGVRELLNLWIGAADRSFDKVFRTEEYARVQGQFVTDYMNYRIQEQAIVEEMMRYGYTATRSEVDEAHRKIQELRRELKALKKSIGQKSAAQSKPKPASKAEPQPQS